jgi:uncharacterized protein YvpB
LNHFEGFNLHFVLLYGFDGKNLHINDPGNPPIPGRKLTLEEFREAYDYPGANKALNAFSK